MKTKNYLVLVLIMLYSISNISCGNSNKTSATEGRDSVDVAKSVEEQEPEYLTFSKAYSIVETDTLINQLAIEKLFEECSLTKIKAKEFAVEFEPDPSTLSTGIDYCWGYGVEYKDWEMKAISDDYYGVSFTLSFTDDLGKKGTIRDITIITNLKKWYDRFMKDAKEAKFVYSEEISSWFGSGKTYIVDIDGVSYFYIHDSSENEKYNIAIGYDNGGDI